MLKRLCLILTVTAFLALTGTVRADVTDDDIRLLDLMFRSRYVPYSQQPDADPAVTEIAASAQKFRRSSDVDNAEKYRTLIKGCTMILTGTWNEAQELGTIMDMRLPAKLYEPGDKVKPKVFPLYERAEPLDGKYAVQVKLIDTKGETIGQPVTKHFQTLEPIEFALSIPADIVPGRYAVDYTIHPDHGDNKQPSLNARRGIFVMSEARNRIDKLAEKRAQLREKHVGDISARHKLAVDTIDWYLGIYNRALREDVPGAYSGHPICMVAPLAMLGYTFERMDFTNELALAEELADALLAGGDPLQTRTGDMRLAYASPVDGELVPFRIFVPGLAPSMLYPLAIALHGAGGDENSFMDRYDGLYKNNARERGYIAVAVNGRGPYGGYRGDSGQDTLDVLELVQTVYPIDKKRTYLTGHSMGGAGATTIGFDNPERFAALAVIAGFGRPAQLAKAKDMPILIAQGDQDALVPVAAARGFYKTAQRLEMPHVKYIELEGVDHLEIATLAMNDIFDWFDKFSKQSL